MSISVRICSRLSGENVHSKSAACKPPDAPVDVSPKSVTSSGETIMELSTVPVFKSHKRQRSDAMVENSPAQEGFLVRRSHSAAEAEEVQRGMDTDEMCKPRAIYPVNFKAPKMYDSPSTTRRSMDLEIPSCGDSSPAPSPAGDSSCHGQRNFCVGPFHKESFNMAKWSSSRRLSRHRSRADSLCKPQQQQQEEGAPSYDDGDGEEEHSQLSIDLERISLAASSVSPFSPSRPTLLPVVFSPIQLVAYRGQNTAAAEGKIEQETDEEEEEDEELVLSLPVAKEASTITGSTNNHSLNHHSYNHYLHHKHTLDHHNPVTSMKTSTQPPSFNNNIDFYNNRTEAVEDADLLDAGMLIFNMDV